MKTKTKRIVMASMLAALVCIATIVIVVPTPFKGYINAGDGVVLLCGLLLSPAYGFFAAAVGAALADLILGYVIYAPATFVIKGLMALSLSFLFKNLKKHTSDAVSCVLGGIVSEAIMVMGYYIYEGFLYGFLASAVNIPANMIQGAAGILLGTILYGILSRKIKRV